MNFSSTMDSAALQNYPCDFEEKIHVAQHKGCEVAPSTKSTTDRKLPLEYHELAGLYKHRRNRTGTQNISNKGELASEAPSCVFQNLLDRLVLERVAGSAALALSPDNDEYCEGDDTDFEYLNDTGEFVDCAAPLVCASQRNDNRFEVSQLQGILSALNQRISETESAAECYDEDDIDSLNSNMTQDSIEIAKRRLGMLKQEGLP